MPIDDAERERRRALLHAHYDVENNHDLDRIMATFSTDAEMLYNRQSFADPESIRTAHASEKDDSDGDLGHLPHGAWR